MPSARQVLLQQIFTSLSESGSTEAGNAKHLERKDGGGMGEMIGAQGEVHSKMKPTLTSFMGDVMAALGDVHSRNQKNALKFPQTGVMNDPIKKRYIMSPGYWVWWKQVENPGMPGTTGINAPPAVWWQQREMWRDVWPRLYNGEEGRTLYPFMPPSPPWPKRFQFGMGEFYAWLQNRFPQLVEPHAPKPPMPKFPKPGEGPMKQPEELGEFWDYKDGGFFGKADARSLHWIAENSMRRQSLPGKSQALYLDSDALAKVNVRLNRMQEDNGFMFGQRATTLDPRPPRPIDNVVIRSGSKPSQIEPFEDPAGLLNAMGNAAVEALAGGSMLEMRAFKRLMRLQPDWMVKYREYKMAEHLYEKGKKEAADDLMDARHAHEAKLARQRNKKRSAPGMVQEPPEPEWHMPKKQHFKDVYEDMWQKFWPAMEVLSRRHGRAAEKSTMDIGAKWRALHEEKKPHIEETLANGIEERAGGDLRAVRALWGGPKEYLEEPHSAIDQQVPVSLPPRDPVQPLEPAPPNYAKPSILKEAPPPMPAVPEDPIERQEHFIKGVPAGKKGRGVEALIPKERVKDFTEAQAIGPAESIAVAPILADVWREVQILRDMHSNRARQTVRREGCSSECECSRTSALRAAFL